MGKFGKVKPPHRHDPPLIKFIYKKQVSLHIIAEVLGVSFKYAQKAIRYPSKYLTGRDMLVISSYLETSPKIIVCLCMAERITEAKQGKWFQMSEAEMLTAEKLIRSLDDIPTSDELERLGML